MSLISKLETDWQKAVSFFISTGKTLVYDVVPALQKVEAAAGTVEAVTNLISPELGKVETAGFALLGAAIQAIIDAEQTGQAGLVNISLDAATVSDIKGLMPAIKNVIKTL